MIQVECPLCGESCRMEMATIAAAECVLRCEGCRVAVQVGEPQPAQPSPMALAA